MNPSSRKYRERRTNVIDFPLLLGPNSNTIGDDLSEIVISSSSISSVVVALGSEVDSSEFVISSSSMSSVAVAIGSEVVSVVATSSFFDAEDTTFCSVSSKLRFTFVLSIFVNLLVYTRVVVVLF